MEPNKPVSQFAPVNEHRIQRAARRRDNQIKALDEYVALQRARIQAEYDAAVNPPVSP